jgi:predicted nucleic acid-binding protein
MEKKAMGKKILIDTTILIKIIRGDTTYIEEVEKGIGKVNAVISIITFAEIVQGMRRGEKRKTMQLLNSLNLQHIDQTISEKFYQIIRGLPLRVMIADRLIAATALMNGYEVFTLNKKDFDDVEGIKFYKPKFVSLKR